ncbi:hypothetical protein BKA93DRAFT_307527 [Sparassis latifolia]
MSAAFESRLMQPSGILATPSPLCGEVHTVPVSLTDTAATAYIGMSLGQPDDVSDTSTTKMVYCNSGSIRKTLEMKGCSSSQASDVVGDR